jgi:hypothetical protein
MDAKWLRQDFDMPTVPGGRSGLAILMAAMGLMGGCAGFADMVNLRESDSEGRFLFRPEVLEQGARCGGPRAGVEVRHETANTVRLNVNAGMRRSGGWTYRLANPALIHDPATDTVTVRVRERAPEPDEVVIATVTWPCLVLRADMWPDPDRVELEFLEEERIYEHQAPEFHPAD